jgi:hypothetical protein
LKLIISRLCRFSRDDLPKDQALASYGKSLQLNPDGANAKAMIKRLE